MIHFFVYCFDHTVIIYPRGWYDDCIAINAEEHDKEGDNMQRPAATADSLSSILFSDWKTICLVAAKKMGLRVTRVSLKASERASNPAPDNIGSTKSQQWSEAGPPLKKQLTDQQAKTETAPSLFFFLPCPDYSAVWNVTLSLFTATIVAVMYTRRFRAIPSWSWYRGHHRAYHWNHLYGIRRLGTGWPRDTSKSLCTGFHHSRSRVAQTHGIRQHRYTVHGRYSQETGCPKPRWNIRRSLYDRKYHAFKYTYAQQRRWLFAV